MVTTSARRCVTAPPYSSCLVISFGIESSRLVNLGFFCLLGKKDRLNGNFHWKSYDVKFALFRP